MSGKVYLVGAGPGAADLLTLRAARLLAAADLVLHDALVTDDILALAPQARKLPVGKRANRPSTDQAVINRLLVRAARHHQMIVRLKGGDPMLFGRAQEEIDALRAAGVAYEIVPGISAGFAAAAEIAQSLTHRRLSRSVAFVTPAVARGTATDETWADAAAAADTAVIYMGKAEAARVRDALTARGVPARRPAVLVEGASRGGVIAGGSLATLEALAACSGDGPALLLIGEAFARAAAEHALPVGDDVAERA
ncbi:Uroporphyrinogen-III C-methyltransferase [Alphaproteobacteria bacterium SO-S41]|nr:Uroporphyrinogen-III C-methyltransferase [Alphaproteobacteria bacterium SO-S41]